MPMQVVLTFVAGVSKILKFDIAGRPDNAPTFAANAIRFHLHKRVTLSKSNMTLYCEVFVR